MIIKLQKTSFQAMGFEARSSQGKPKYRRLKTADLEILAWTADYDFGDFSLFSNAKEKHRSQSNEADNREVRLFDI